MEALTDTLRHADWKSQWRGVIAVTVGVIVTFFAEIARFFVEGGPDSLFWGLFPALILYNERHWFNKVAFGLVYAVIVVIVFPRIVGWSFVTTCVCPGG